MITIAVVNSKGGVGKTTLAAALSVRAAEASAVAMVDLDPQKSLVEWWQARGETDNPTIFEGEYDAGEAIEKLRLHGGYDFVFLDSPPAFLETLADCITNADFVLIPLRPSMIDMSASQDAFVLARDSGTPMMLVLNDCHKREDLTSAAHELLKRDGVPIADTQIYHRKSHTSAMSAGKVAAELKDREAAAQIEALWKEVRTAAEKSVKRRAIKRSKTRG